MAQSHAVTWLHMAQSRVDHTQEKSYRSFLSPADPQLLGALPGLLALLSL